MIEYKQNKNVVGEKVIEQNVATSILTTEEVEGLINELHEASVKYYQTNEDSGISDSDFDAKLEYLQELAATENYKTLFSPGSKGYSLIENAVALGTSIDEESETFTHKSPMLSLDKAKKVEQLDAYLKRVRASGAKGFRLQAKFDGLALSVHYNKGKITTIATRGDGLVGADSTFMLNDSDLSIVGLPRSVSNQKKLEVRGELMFTTQQFKKADDARFKLTGQRFKNSRNSASGLLKKSKAGIGYPVELTFVAYSVLENNELTELSKASEEEGFLNADNLTAKVTPTVKLEGFANDEELMENIQKFGNLRESLDIPTDGIVIKPIEEAKLHKTMGVKTSHPASQIAWKYPSETAETFIKSIDVTVGKTGRLTPVARIEPVELDGSEISNASLHNFNLIAIKDIRIGSIVRIEKAGEIIPQVASVIKNPENTTKIVAPTHCPSCSKKLDYNPIEGSLPPKTIKCANINCPSREFYALMTAVGKNYFDIDGLSESTLTFFTETKRVLNIADIFTLTKEELANSTNGYTEKGTARRLGESKAEHILKYIENSKTKPLPKILAAMNVDLLGRTASKKLEAAFKDIDGILAASEDQIRSVDGLGDITAENIYNGLQLRRELINRLRELGVTFGKIESTEDESTQKEDNAIRGLSFAISGSVPEPFGNRTKWVDYIEENGGVFHSAPKAETNYMVGNKDDSSSKIKKALKLGIEFLTAEEFTEQFVK